MIYHVAKTGNDNNAGNEKNPFLTISKATRIVRSGDTVIVHEGEYRECVSPVFGGDSAYERITYTSADGEKVIIKGSEVIKGWAKDGSVWRVTIDNALFGDYNPYTTTIDGDWLVSPIDKFLHTGAVYVYGNALREVTDTSELTENTWFTEQKDGKTAIYANFGGYDPNQGITEINVRQSCFYPKETGVNYITVRGFEMAHAATPWAPPTADQPGLIGPHWSKGWIIEDNIIHDSRCCGISLGKEISTGHNPAVNCGRKSGYQYQLETVFRVIQVGWCKEKIGSHIIRNNSIYDCGQNGIVGNHGGAFSEIYGNHIYNIGNKQEFFGYEIAGIKLHAAIDTHIHHNVIHNCFWGTWLDWQAQGARLSSNIYFDNIDKDLWLEVTHGPLMVDNNIFASEKNFTNNVQGAAFVNNIFAGTTQYYSVLDRSTPYHFAHSTQVAGCAAMYSGDNRYYNNIFCGKDADGWKAGTDYYNCYSASLEEYLERVHAHGRGDIEIFKCEKQPIYINNNCYLDEAQPFDREETNINTSDASNISVTMENGNIYLEITLPKEFDSLQPYEIKTETLARPRICELPFENPDGTPIEINTDMLGNTYRNTIGPISKLKSGENRVLIWSMH